MAMPHEDNHESLAIFPLSGVVLFPGARLPLRLFEPRYLRLAEDLERTDGMLGVIQPRADFRDPIPENCDVYGVGTAGKIVHRETHDDGTLGVVIEGISRFHMIEELDAITPYRQARVDFRPYEADQSEKATGRNLEDRENLMTVFAEYLEALGAHAHFSGIETANDDALTASLAMAIPLEPREKQALLEAPTVWDRGRLTVTMLKIATQGEAASDAPRLQ